MGLPLGGMVKFSAGKFGSFTLLSIVREHILGFIIISLIKLKKEKLEKLVNLYLPSLYFTFDPGLTVTVTVNFIFTLREPNVYKPHGFFLGFLATFICFCVTVLFYRSLYFVVNQIK